MKMRRPRTLLGLVLLGLAFVTVPLLIAIGNAVLKLGQLAIESEAVLGDSATATLQNEKLVSLLSGMERNALQYLQLQGVVASASELLNLYDSDQVAFEESLAALTSLPKDPDIAEQLRRLTSISKEVHWALRSGANNGSIDMITDTKALVEKAGLKEGSNATPAEFVVEKAFVG